MIFRFTVTSYDGELVTATEVALLLDRELDAGTLAADMAKFSGKSYCVGPLKGFDVSRDYHVNWGIEP